MFITEELSYSTGGVSYVFRICCNSRLSPFHIYAQMHAKHTAISVPTHTYQTYFLSICDIYRHLTWVHKWNIKYSVMSSPFRFLLGGGVVRCYSGGVRCLNDGWDLQHTHIYMHTLAHTPLFNIPMIIVNGEGFCYVRVCVYLETFQRIDYTYQLG